MHVPTLGRTQSGRLYYLLGDFRTLFPLSLPYHNYVSELRWIVVVQYHSYLV
jgi:hypothetical protein